MRISVIDAPRARDAILGDLCSPAAAERPEAADEEFAGAAVDAVKG